MVPPMISISGGEPGCVLPYYHMVSDEPAPHVEHLYRFRTIKEFNEDLEYFLRRFKPLGLGGLLDGKERQSNGCGGTFLLSFDDGFREMHDVVAPILKAKGIPAVFFLTSNMVDNRELCFHQKMSLLLDCRQNRPTGFPKSEVTQVLKKWGIEGEDDVVALKSVQWLKRGVLDEIASKCDYDFEDFLRRRRPYLDSTQVTSMIRDGFDIGAHSVDHPRYADIEISEQLRQTHESMGVLGERFSPRRKVFAFPHTDHGVSRKFFDTIFKEGIVEATFGTGAPCADSVRGSYQRFSMEKMGWPAGAIMGRRTVRGLKLRAAGKSVIQRE
jgi:peptidoglycan/xylan/chitin deacetylase (PgdA/CDA1 family)